jgi:ribonuclease-3
MIFDYKFKNQELLETALTHKSYAVENTAKDPLSGSVTIDKYNERLEFLGDSVLELTLSEFLVESFPEKEEGELSKMRAHLVNEAGLASHGERLGLAQILKLGKGEVLSKGAQKPRLIASVFEAVVGALFLDAGFEVTRTYIRELFQAQIEELKNKPYFDQDYKSQLQELLQSLGKRTPVYELKAQLGPAHDRIFEVQVLMGDHVLAEGQGKTKKSAEQVAAAAGIEEFKKLKGSDV